MTYVVAAPLLLQDLASWSESGIQGLQVGYCGKSAKALYLIVILVPQGHRHAYAYCCWVEAEHINLGCSCACASCALL
jgi:hypothetical protein